MKDSTKKHVLGRRRFMDAIGTSAVAAQARLLHLARLSGRSFQR